MFSVAGLDLDGILPTSVEMDCSSSDFMLNYVEAVRKMGDEEAQQVNVKYLKTKHELSENFQQLSQLLVLLLQNENLKLNGKSFDRQMLLEHGKMETTEENKII